MLNPQPDFRLLHINHLGERILASLALVEGQWNFRTQGRLLGIGNKTN